MGFDEVRERCGVVALYQPESSGDRLDRLAYYGLLALQHRGQDSAGIVVALDGRLFRHRGTGLVQDVFDESALNAAHATAAVGHVRYATAGGTGESNIQPLLGSTRAGHRFALAHNGNLLAVDDADDLAGRRHVDRTGEADADTPVLVRALSDQDGDTLAAMLAVLPRVSGAFSLAVATPDGLLAARDPNGFRPLCLGRLPGGGWITASETTALDAVGAAFLREVEPGELLSIGPHGVLSHRFASPAPSTCIFEYVYFARPDSMLNGRRVQQVRQAMGAALAHDAPAAADVVVPTPDTARPAALGYAAASGIPYAEALIRNTYVGRSFIMPADGERRHAVDLKLNAIPETVEGRRVVLIDDSVVRANTARAVVTKLRRAGAAEVHLRVASSPLRWPCFFGVDISTKHDLAARARSVPEVGELIGADSIGYLSLEAMKRAIGGGRTCDGCFTGTYPLPLPLPLTTTATAGR
ncbi:MULTISPECIES: amidophosphoribosyltransferase [unclassified Nonomuraea]|uniref:amidophosphoribosyltransferase n=1 Tax=unclassified Nonomuraea TaxID=2593643 RepID=UPI0034069FF4